MKNVKILDCTLRDGGRIINCKFNDSHVKGITEGLTESRIDIVEMGFLRSNTTYSGNSTIFTELDQIKRFIPEDRGNTMYVAFSDYGEEFGMWDFKKLPECDGKTITGIRVGYRKKDLKNAIDTFRRVIGQGYELFIQGVESLNYSDREFLEAIDVVNEIHPHSFGIVDTYGTMYKDDVIRLYNLVNHNLREDISIDFHSHNNLQLSFSFAIEMIELSKGKRNIILDATLEGLGKGTGNLNTELIVDYLNRKCQSNYEMDRLLDCIDGYIPWIKQEHTWAYQIPYFMAGLYSSHANNIIYLTDKHRLKNSDIKNIIMRMDPIARKRYNYDDLQKLYIDYFSSNVDDCETLKMLKRDWKGRPVLILVPGGTLADHKDQIDKYIREKNPVIISVNFVSEYPDAYSFFGNELKYQHELKRHGIVSNVLLASNVEKKQDGDLSLNYNRLIENSLKHFDNSTVMLLNLMKRMNLEQISFAGFDGFDGNTKSYFYPADEPGVPVSAPVDADELNEDLCLYLTRYASQLRKKGSIVFLTPSRFEHLFGDGER